MEVLGIPHDGAFTAKEIRKIADDLDNGKGFNIYESDGDGGLSLCAVKTIDCQAALRQGADAIDRLEKVVKIAEEARSKMSCDACKARCRREDEIPDCEAGRHCEAPVYFKIIRAAKGGCVNVKYVVHDTLGESEDLMFDGLSACNKHFGGNSKLNLMWHVMNGTLFRGRYKIERVTKKTTEGEGK